MLKRYMNLEKISIEQVAKECKIPVQKIENLIENIVGEFSLREVVALTIFCECKPRIMFQAPRTMRKKLECNDLD